MEERLAPLVAPDAPGHGGDGGAAVGRGGDMRREADARMGPERMIRRQGLAFDLKLLDFFDLGKPTKGKIYKDVLNLVQVFHTIVGGRERYTKQPRVVKEIIRGLKDSLILERFSSAGDIQRHLENLTWE